ncbi:MAG: MBL fold metallo-hydrolase [Gammaproteobacteria bacterium]|nr:MBL fold metallo-hydrolase [Gammaproteobacteria bacterium]
MSAMEFHHPAPSTLGKREALLPGLDWIRLSLPFALDHVNCWWLHDGSEQVLIDTGVSSKHSRRIWDELLRVNGLPQKLLVTHFHPDHTGLSGWFKQQGVGLISHEVEQRHSQDIYSLSDEAYAQRFHDWYIQNGLELSATKGVWTLGNGYKQLVYAEPDLIDWQFLQHGEELLLAGRTFRVIVGHGHAPAMLMLYCERDGFLIAADQVLPTISPNVSLMPGSKESDPLDGFLNTLTELMKLPADTLVLPSHGEPFTGLHGRVQALLDHHEQRLDLLENELQAARQAAGLFSVLFQRELDDLQLGFALGETLAHLQCLIGRGRVNVEMHKGVDWYSQV